MKEEIKKKASEFVASVVKDMNDGKDVVIISPYILASKKYYIPKVYQGGSASYRISIMNYKSRIGDVIYMPMDKKVLKEALKIIREMHGSLSSNLLMFNTGELNGYISLQSIVERLKI